ncbi:hypothetical protein Tco_0952485 [Tanacetum coccineum]|uniref:Uncharacterized protein n=1 Tax=Tanacetum coccineum TaxID=301880 RepID=A0ABQ5DX63_9ASTR
MVTEGDGFNVLITLTIPQGHNLLLVEELELGGSLENTGLIKYGIVLNLSLIEIITPILVKIVPPILVEIDPPILVVLMVLLQEGITVQGRAYASVTRNFWRYCRDKCMHRALDNYLDQASKPYLSVHSATRMELLGQVPPAERSSMILAPFEYLGHYRMYRVDAILITHDAGIPQKIIDPLVHPCLCKNFIKRVLLIALLISLFERFVVLEIETGAAKPVTVA